MLKIDALPKGYKYKAGDEDRYSVLLSDCIRGIWSCPHAIETLEGSGMIGDKFSDDLPILKDPYHEDHHEALDEFEENWCYTDENGNEWGIIGMETGDVFLYPMEVIYRYFSELSEEFLALYQEID